jgi:hypothetical protein
MRDKKKGTLSEQHHNSKRASGNNNTPCQFKYDIIHLSAEILSGMSEL